MGPVTQDKLAAAVDKAIHAAAIRKDLALNAPMFDGDHIRVPWWIVGRVVRGDLKLEDAHGISEKITERAKVELEGMALQPTTIKIDKHILVGFIEKYSGQIAVPDILAGPGHAR